MPETATIQRAANDPRHPLEILLTPSFPPAQMAQLQRCQTWAIEGWTRQNLQCPPGMPYERYLKLRLSAVQTLVDLLMDSGPPSMDQFHPRWPPVPETGRPPQLP